MSFSAGGVVEADLEPLVEAFRKLEHTADARLRLALGMFASEVAVEAKQNHDYTDRTQKLTASIQEAPVQGSFLTGMRVDVVAGGVAGVKYAAAVEHGTRAHIIRAKRKKALSFRAGGTDIARRSVSHPGTRPYRFMRNALEAKLPRAEALVETAMQQAMDEVGL